MKTLLSLITLLALALLTLLPSLHAESITATHLKGSVELPLKPSRIVVLDYSALDTIHSLGIDVDIALAKQGLPDYLAAYKADRYLDLGTLKEFNLESISAFKPQAIFITTRQATYYDELAKIAPVYIVNGTAPDTLEEIKKTIRTVSQVFDKEAEAAQHLAEIASLATSIKQQATSSGKKALFLLANDGKIAAYGKGSRFGMVYSILGLAQAGPEIAVSRHGQRINYEYIALAKPDIIYLLDRSAAIGRGAPLENFAKNPLVSTTPAARNGSIVPLDSRVWYLVGGGIHATKVMLNDVAKAFQS